MPRALDVPSVIAGEAVSGTPQERWADMVAIASVIANRAAALGVTPQQVIANTNEFNAYNRAMPPGTAALTEMAQEAMNYVEENGPVNNATFYATPAAVNNLPSGLQPETSTTGHQYFSDPQNRAIGTSLGYRQPNQYAYAANPENVPTPDQPSLMAGTGELGNTWTINGVTPHLGPVAETWSAMAAADPVQAPTGGLLSAAPAQNSFADMAAAGPMGLLSTPSISQQTSPAFNGFADLAAAGPLGGQYASPAERMGLLSAPSISQADIERALSNPTSQGMDPSFTAGLMGPSNPVVPTSVETTSYTPQNTVPNVAEAVAPTGTLDSFASAMAAQRQPFGTIGTTVGTGINSPEHINGVQAQAERQLAAARVAQPSGLLSSYVAPTSVTPAEQAISSVTTPGMLSASLGSFPTAMQAQRALPGYHVSDLDGVTMVPDAVAPALDTVEVAEQPTVAEPAIEGPATTPAVSQQTQQAVTQNVQNVQNVTPVSFGDKLKAAVNPGTAIGGILGGATLGPIGGILGALLGNTINQNGFSSLGQQTQPGGLLGVGPAAAYAAWSGNAAPGSYGIATDGSRINSQGGGWTTRTDANGVTTSTSPWGGGAGWFGGDPNDPESYT